MWLLGDTHIVHAVDAERPSGNDTYATVKASDTCV
jgi:hypothetical protein